MYSYVASSDQTVLEAEDPAPTLLPAPEELRPVGTTQSSLPCTPWPPSPPRTLSCYRPGPLNRSHPENIPKHVYPKPDLNFNSAHAVDWILVEEALAAPMSPNGTLI